MENDIRVKYDSLCYATMLNLRTLTSGADRIVLRNFDAKNKEHLFVVAVAMACWGILGERPIAADCGFFARWKLSRRYKDVSKIYSAKKEEAIFVDVEELLDYMRGTACELCGDDFRFGDIYDAYYNVVSGYDV